MSTTEQSTPNPIEAPLVEARRLCDLISDISDAEQPEVKKESPEVVFVNSSEFDDGDFHSVEVAEPENSPIGEIESYRLIHEDVPETSGCFAVDPYAFEETGEIPVMPSIPIVDATEMTRRILSRQTDGQHNAWTLAPNTTPQSSSPYPSPDGANGASSDDFSSPQSDRFFAGPGEVIFVDGNLGFDHIDLSVYDINDATFQPGAILLYPDANNATEDNRNFAPQPITIRYRGVSFAIFKNNLRVDL